jgi:hypothetical protein
MIISALTGDNTTPWTTKVGLGVLGLILAVPASILLSLLLHVPLLAWLGKVVALPVVGLSLLVWLIYGGSALWTGGLGAALFALGVFCGYRAAQKVKPTPPSFQPAPALDRKQLMLLLGVQYEWQLQDKLCDLFRQTQRREPSYLEEQGLEEWAIRELGRALQSGRRQSEQATVQENQRAAAPWALNALYAFVLGLAAFVSAGVLWLRAS